MKRYLLSLLVAIVASLTVQAQYILPDKYDLWFEDTGNEVTTRKPVACTENYQDLWNGCYVRLNNKKVYIYNDDGNILYGDEIDLLYNGYYRVRRGNTWYLADKMGNLVEGIEGKQITYYPFDYVSVQRSSYWGLYHCSGRKVGPYSYECPLIFYNGYFSVKQGTYWFACDQDGNNINNVYGNKIVLLKDGRWKCIQGDKVKYVE